MKVLMSIKPKFVERIFAGTKTFELRKKLFKKKSFSLSDNSCYFQ